MSSAKLDALINALRALPGIGPKSAQRMALRLLGQNRPLALRLAQALTDAVEHVRYCSRCRTLSDQPLCRICADPARDQALLMVVESPADVLAVEQGAGYRGLYFVLHGRLSPLEGVGPEQLRLGEFVARIQNEPPTEIILATNATVEGEATAHYLTELCRGLPVKLSRIGFGLPYGSEVEWADRGTLAHALSGRQVLL